MTAQNNLPYGFQFHEVKLELSVLGEQLGLIPGAVELGEKKAREEFDARMAELAANRHEFTKDEEHCAWWEYQSQTSFVVPLICRNPFLISMYAVYEAAVRDVSRLAQYGLGEAKSIDKMRMEGGFLAKSREHYSSILNFELTENECAWKRIEMLSCLRNIVAHSNGQLERAKCWQQDKVKCWSQQGIGVKDDIGYLIVTQEFLEETFAVVKSELEGLVDRYQQWDTANRKARRSGSG